VGRPAKLTKSRSDRIIEAVRNGAPRQVAAQAAGIAKSTLQTWLVKGEAADAPATSMHRRFAEGLRQAEAEREIAALGDIATAATKDWRAAAWWLQHGPARERYAKVDQHRISGPDGEALKIDGGWDLSALSEKELAALQAIAVKAQASNV
jgi:hypothetical protein